MSIFTAAIMVALTLVPAVQAKTPNSTEKINVVALGDSVAYGMSASGGYGYNDMLNTYLTDEFPEATVKYKNLSNPGDTTGDLLEVIELYPGIIKQADIITINIGGNNILSPFIAAAKTTLGLSEDASLDDLNEAINAAGGLMSVMGTLLNPTPEKAALVADMNAGGLNFAADWPEIIGQIKMLAPEAEIYVNTIYNPLCQVLHLGAVLPAPLLPYYLGFYSFIEYYLDQMNNLILPGETAGIYHVVDVDAIFNGINPLTGPSPVEFNIYGIPYGTPFNVDIHPGDYGHEQIYLELLDEM